MPVAQLAITKEYVRCFLALIGKGIFWPESVRTSLRALGLDSLDVTYVMTHGDPDLVERETAHGTYFKMTGATCDDVLLSVEFWTDVNQMSIRILGVERI